MGEKRLEIPFYARYLLTVNEAACYFNIGAKKMRTLVSEHEGAKWMIYNGNRIMIKKRAVRILAGSADSYLTKSDRLKEEV